MGHSPVGIDGQGTVTERVSPILVRRACSDIRFKLAANVTAKGLQYQPFFGCWNAGFSTMVNGDASPNPGLSSSMR